MRIEEELLQLILKIIPTNLHLPVEYSYRKTTGMLPFDLLNLNEIIGKGQRAIDIGANTGLYTYALSQICEVVEAFEPQELCANKIVEYSKKLGNGRINVRVVGLSADRGTMNLHIPILRGRFRTKLAAGLATYRKLDCEHQTIAIPIHRLDDYRFKDVSFIKIDVEGHEYEVIEGAKETILQNKPIILVEIVPDHLSDRAIESVFDRIVNLGYQGSFLYEGKWSSLSEFSLEKHQKNYTNKREYLYNFLFKPAAN
ncbi:MAG: FkbM family methyltransferase [Cyanosarcina radialis HA8281-LM2]|jgi:FkbM family methyltransferase|nr:FkbM family methyltransferase [Cyanosarcina radialis HA8281-LM2]